MKRKQYVTHQCWIDGRYVAIYDVKFRRFYVRIGANPGVRLHGDHATIRDAVQAARAAIRRTPGKYPPTHYCWREQAA